MTYRFHHILYQRRLILTIALLFVVYYCNNLAGGWKSFENIFYYFFVVLGIVFLALVENIFSKRKEYNITTVDIVLTLFAIYVTLRTTLENSAFWENESFLVFITLYLVYFVYKQLFTNTAVVKIFLVSVTLLGFLASGHGILQGLGFVEDKNPLFNITGAFVNPQVYGGYLASLLPFTVVLYFFSKNSPYQRFFVYLSLITTLSLLVVIVLTQSRAAWLASVVSVGCLLEDQYSWLKRAKIFFTRPGILVGLLTALLLLPGLLFFLKPDSAVGRVLIWRISLPMGWDNLLLGIGYGQFKIHYLDYQADFFALHEGLTYAEKIAGMTYHAFNEFLQIALELGVVGLLLYFGLLIVVFRRNKVEKQIVAKKIDARTLSQSSIINILVFSLFSYPFSILPLYLLFFVSLALLSSTMNNQYIFFTSGLSRLTLMAIVVACSLLGKIQWERYQATKQWRQAAFTFSFDNESAISSYKKVYSRLAYKGEFLYNYGAELSEAGYASQSVYILEQAKNKFNHLDLHLYLGKSYQEMGENLKAEQAYHHAMYMVPHRFLPKYLLVKLYQETGEHEKAIAMANLILNMEEKVPSNVTQDIKAEMKEFLSEK